MNKTIFERSTRAASFALLVTKITRGACTALLSIAAASAYAADPADLAVAARLKVLVTLGLPGSPGSYPTAGLTKGPNGKLYGVTSAGGWANRGTVFMISLNGAMTVLHTFVGIPDGGAPPSALVLGSDGNFYGTTRDSGRFGAIYRLSPNGDATIFHAFNDSLDGTFPNGGLVEGSDGSFYGTTTSGGIYDKGVVFAISPAGQETILHNFAADGIDGSAPIGTLIQSTDGTFYGTTMEGGQFGQGTVFAITSTGQEAVLHSFGASASDGVYPTSGVIQGADGNFYGVTGGGGASNVGMVFMIAPGGAETVLHSFADDGMDGKNPGHLTLGSDGNFYGTTVSGGIYGGGGTVFRLTPDGSETVLYSFGPAPKNKTGNAPVGPLLEVAPGLFYAAANAGGLAGVGTLFSLQVAPAAGGTADMGDR